MKKIARDLHLSRNTARKFLRSGETDFTYERERQPMPRITHHCAIVETGNESWRFKVSAVTVTPWRRSSRAAGHRFGFAYGL